ncbi:MAG: phage holin family protein [Rhizobacter sp.]|nr:phage holin family protein [Ferruginibacter sp.]
MLAKVWVRKNWNTNRQKLSKIISKMVLYQVALITFFILEFFLLGEFVLLFTSIPYLLTKIVAAFFCFIELTSINENIKAVYGLNFFQMFKHLLSRVKEVKDELNDLSSKIEKHLQLKVLF